MPLIHGLDVLPYVWIDGRDGIQAFCKGFDVETGAAYHDGVRLFVAGYLLSENLLCPLQGEGFESAGREIFQYRMRIDEIMMHCCQLFRRRFCNADMQLFKALTAVGRYDAGGKLLCEADGGCRRSHCSRSYDNDDSAIIHPY